jgi:hypothetical protein
MPNLFKNLLLASVLHPMTVRHFVAVGDVTAEPSILGNSESLQGVVDRRMRTTDEERDVPCGETVNGIFLNQEVFVLEERRG